MNVEARAFHVFLVNMNARASTKPPVKRALINLNYNMYISILKFRLTEAQCYFDTD